MMSTISEPSTLEVKSLDGTVLGSDSLALKVADKEVAKGLVHRYAVLVQQNARSVRLEVAFLKVQLCTVPLVDNQTFISTFHSYRAMPAPRRGQK
jgi:hypothetical protein